MTVTDSSTIVSPIDGTVVGEVEYTSINEIPAVFARARQALPGWRAMSGRQRSRLLIEVARRIRVRAAEIAELESRNTGKRLADTEREAQRAADCFEYYAGWADKAVGETIPMGPDFHVYTERDPYGIAVGIIPWNVPFFFAAKKIAPALAFGNVSILKPAAETPLTALVLASILGEAGVPAGVAQVVLGGADVGAAVVSDPETDLVVFTGHHETGRRIAAAATEHLVPVALELGGKSPQLVFEDADLDAALDGVTMGIFGSCGQMCIAGSRLYVQESVHDAFVERMVERVSSLRVGNPLDRSVQVGPQVTRAQAAKTDAFIAIGQDEGARLLAQAPLPTDPTLANGFFVPPTLFGDVEPGMRLLEEEIFGPVLAVASFRDEDDAIRRAHETEFGLAAGVWTNDVGRAHRVARALQVGTVWVNTYRVLSDLVPFGGIGLSGYGREGGSDAVNLYTRSKSVWVQTASGLAAGYSL